MDIREEIKSILMEVFSEATPSRHYKDRIYDRLSSTLYTRPRFDYSAIEGDIDLIKKVNFPEYESVGINLRRYPDTYTSKDPSSGSVSIGDELWAVVRDNVITTIFFRNSSQPAQDSSVENLITIQKLRHFYDNSEKNEDGTVDLDFSKPEKKHRQGKGQRKKIELDFPVVEINGKKWYIDEPNEELIYAKNIKKKIAFDDLKEEIFEKVIDAVTIQSAA
jgi:hypothetical protein